MLTNGKSGSEQLNETPEAVLAVAASAQSPQPSQSALRFNTSDIKSSYCNVCNATSTREEVVLVFGSNHDWDLGSQTREVQLHHRIVLSPYAAKRLDELLQKLMREHEARYGELK